MMRKQIEIQNCKLTPTTVDEILFKTSKFSPDSDVTFTCGTRFFSPFMSIGIEGKFFNAFESDEDNGSILGNSVLKNLGLSPEYSYNKGVNTYYFRRRGRPCKTNQQRFK